ncbi:alpha-hydroxy acid oxidase [Zhengella sp. ZM62]|uniref:alpha-hydroxy acid oxidase n=1 Tax=Zhengella sedimenti TaxID=3390035 RepID=UPI0039763493
MTAPGLAGIRTIEGLRALARRRLPRGLFEFIDRGTGNETALLNNRAAYARMRFRPLGLTGCGSRSTAARILGNVHAAPMIIAPTGAAGLVWPNGDLALARAAAAAGIPFTMATRSFNSIEQVGGEAGGTLWFQLYASPDTGFTFPLLERAWQSGFETLVVTIDTPVTPDRHYNTVNGFSLPFHPTARALLDMAMHPRWLVNVIIRYRLQGGLPRFENMPGRPKITQGPPASAMLDARLDWSHVKELRRKWPGKFVIKGVLHEKTALQAAKAGADAIVVSNHGGRNLDTSAAPLDVLPAIAARVDGRMELIVDSGIASGSDIAKAIASGANAVMIGRAPLWGAAAGGETGISRALEILLRELDYTMAMTGCARLDELGPHILHTDPSG